MSKTYRVCDGIISCSICTFRRCLLTALFCTSRSRNSSETIALRRMKRQGLFCAGSNFVHQVRWSSSRTAHRKFNYTNILFFETVGFITDSVAARVVDKRGRIKSVRVLQSRTMWQDCLNTEHEEANRSLVRFFLIWSFLWSRS